MPQNQYMAVGSYQSASRNVINTINALCEETGGKWVQSTPLTYSVSDAQSLKDILNREGNLQLDH
ncbi:MAG: hypothetical protein ACJA08_001907 [Cyclobacteriaceae bacterium]|jgi:hypothetical protein